MDGMPGCIVFLILLGSAAYSYLMFYIGRNWRTPLHWKWIGGMYVMGVIVVSVLTRGLFAIFGG